MNDVSFSLRSYNLYRFTYTELILLVYYWNVSFWWADTLSNLGVRIVLDLPFSFKVLVCRQINAMLWCKHTHMHGQFPHRSWTTDWTKRGAAFSASTIIGARLLFGLNHLQGRCNFQTFPHVNRSSPKCNPPSPDLIKIQGLFIYSKLVTESKKTISPPAYLRRAQLAF